MSGSGRWRRWGDLMRRRSPRPLDTPSKAWRRRTWPRGRASEPTAAGPAAHRTQAAGFALCRLSGLDRPASWRVVNVTPDSFSDGGEPSTRRRRRRRPGWRVWPMAGGGIIDIGGESTRPGAPCPRGGGAALGTCSRSSRRSPRPAIVVSIDTRRAAVMRAASGGRARLVINDVTALTGDPESLHVAAQLAGARCWHRAHAHAGRAADHAAATTSYE